MQTFVADDLVRLKDALTAGAIQEARDILHAASGTLDQRTTRDVATAFTVAGYPDDADRILAAGVEGHPNDFWRLCDYAEHARRCGRLEDALQRYRSATERFPREPLSLVNEGQVLAQLGDFDGAERALAAACALGPDSFWPALRYAALARQRGLARQGLSRARDLLVRFPAEPLGYHEYIQTLRALGMHESAAEAARLATARFPDNQAIAELLRAAERVPAGRVNTDPQAMSLTPAVVETARNDKSFAQLITQMEVKNALTERLSVREGFEAYRQMLDLPDTGRIQLKPLRSMHEIAAERALRFIEIAPSGESFTIAPPLVIGEGNHCALEGISRPIFLACLSDARVRGRSSCVEIADAVLLDYQADELTRLDDRLELDPAIFHAQNDEVWVIAPDRESCAIELDEAFTLVGTHTHDFGHWMWEYLPKYIAASLSGELARMPLLIDADMPRTHRQALELMIPKDTPLIELAPCTTARVDRLWWTPTQMHMPLLERMNDRFKWDYLASPPARFVPIIREMARRVEPALSPERGCGRVFLARKPSLPRKLLNYRAIEAAAQARGFRVVHPEDLDFAEQVSLLRDAKFVAGPEGSAFFLAFFARPGARLCLLDHPHTAGLPLLTGPLSEIGIQTVVFTGPFVRIYDEWPHLSDYHIDEAAFCQFLDQWLLGTAP